MASLGVEQVEVWQQGASSLSRSVRCTRIGPFLVRAHGAIIHEIDVEWADEGAGRPVVCGVERWRGAE
jgi:hypothetical protein